MTENLKALSTNAKRPEVVATTESWLAYLLKAKDRVGEHHEAYTVLNKAIAETQKYSTRLQDGKNRDREFELKLSDLWREVADKVQPFDRKLSTIAREKTILHAGGELPKTRNG